MMTKPFAVAPIDDIEARLAAAESALPDIRPGLAKEIVWFDPAGKSRTALAVTYIHGFSASKGEVRPLPDLVATALGANLFYTRLAGHGRSADAMAEASVEAWKKDMAEAFDIAKQIGERTLIIATSTGASLAIWALSQPGLSASVAGRRFSRAEFQDQGARRRPADGAVCRSGCAPSPWTAARLRPVECAPCRLLDERLPGRRPLADGGTCPPGPRPTVRKDRDAGSLHPFAKRSGRRSR